MATINFNVADVAPAEEFVPLPEGRYEAVIAESDVRQTRSGTGSFIELEFEIVSGDYQGRRLWGRYNIENQNMEAVEIGRSQFAAVCRAVNISNPRDTSELHDIPLVLAVKCRKRKDSGELENVISGYRQKESPETAQAAQKASVPGAASRSAQTPAAPQRTAPWAR